jgi:hypothetical protein
MSSTLKDSNDGEIGEDIPKRIELGKCIKIG